MPEAGGVPGAKGAVGTFTGTGSPYVGEDGSAGRVGKTGAG